MPRPILDEAHIHPAIRETIAGHHADIVREVQAAMSRGMSLEQMKKALLREQARKTGKVAAVPRP